MEHSISENYQYLLKLNTHVLSRPAISLLSIYTIEMYTYVQHKIYARKFIAALFKIAPNLKPLLMPINNRWDKSIVICSLTEY